MESVLELEEVAFRAWPAEEVVDLDGYRLRFAHGVTHRANSVWPNVLRGTVPLERRFAAVEAFYESRGLPPSYQLTSACQPADLDAQLAKRGYIIESPVSVETVAVDAFRTPGCSPGVTIGIDSAPSAEWLHVSADRGRFAGLRAPYCGILMRIGSRGGFAFARWQGVLAGVGLGVIDDEWLGIFSMLTLPEARQHGVGRAILAALVEWGSLRGAKRAYLQVEVSNVPARILYRNNGFAPAYPYHYRTKPRETT